ncbi:type II secretion system protein [bacterium]|nr:type II secretion system protein [bacterium]
MKKRGFTLAEVLITLGIIGVVAALTAPALIQDASNASIGPSLEKVVATIELTNQRILYDNNTPDLQIIYAGNANAGNQYLGNLATRIRGAAVAPGNNISFSTPPRYWDMNNMRAEDYDNRNKLILSNNTAILISDERGNQVNFRNFDANNYPNQFGSYRGPLTTLMVDINGVNNGPNVFGRDLFSLTVDRGGAVIADGSAVFNRLFAPPGGDISLSAGAGNNADSSGSVYTCNENSVRSGLGCAGSILDNNRQVIYK